MIVGLIPVRFWWIICFKALYQNLFVTRLRAIGTLIRTFSGEYIYRIHLGQKYKCGIIGEYGRKLLIF